MKKKTELAAAEYLAWLEKVGRGEVETCSDRGENVIQLNDRTISTAQTLTEFVQTVFPNLSGNLTNAEYFAHRGILTPKVVDVDMLQSKSARHFSW